jgi:hypothetical protein
MRNIATRLKKAEDKLNINQTIPAFIIIDFMAPDFIKAGYFKDKVEQDAFLDWRIAQLKAEQKNSIYPCASYLFSEEDVKEHILAFKNSNGITINHPKNESA